MPHLKDLLRAARKVLASSQATAGRARSRIHGSRKRLSQTGDTVIATASRIGAARFALAKR
jgi:hypothetical protein